MYRNEAHGLDGSCLVLAIPRAGRLKTQTIQLLERCNIKLLPDKESGIVHRTFLDGENSKHVAVVFLESKDIPLFVAQGRVDVGITEQYLIGETKAQVESLLELGFGKSSLCVLVPENVGITAVADLAGCRVATPFRHSASRYFDEQLLTDTPTLVSVADSTEVSCRLGLADAAVGVVETEEDLFASGLKKLAVIRESQAVLISNPNSRHANDIRTLHTLLAGIVDANKHMMLEYQIKRENLHLGCKITPGKTSPTLLPLLRDGWVAVRTVILKQETNDVLDQLEGVGADSMSVYNIQNYRA